MVNLPTSPPSGTLHPPRKSIELEDPGAHDLGMRFVLFSPYSSTYLPCADLNFTLDTSENEDDIFSDAQEGRGSSSGANSPIPITRVEKV